LVHLVVSHDASMPHRGLAGGSPVKATGIGRNLPPHGLGIVSTSVRSARQPAVSPGEGRFAPVVLERGWPSFAAVSGTQRARAVRDCRSQPERTTPLSRTRFAELIYRRVWLFVLVILFAATASASRYLIVSSAKSFAPCN
jgi:hypothetical protein